MIESFQSFSKLYDPFVSIEHLQKKKKDFQNLKSLINLWKSQFLTLQFRAYGQTFETIKRKLLVL